MASDKITAAHLLVPFSLIAFVLALFLGFQTTLLVSDHHDLVQARIAQDKDLEQLAKVKNMVTALALGTLKLSQQGDKNASEIMDLLKKANVQVSDQPPAGSAPAAAAPAAPAPAPAP